MNENTTSETNALQVLEPTALEASARAEIDMQISTAKRYPRQLSVVKSNMLSFATLDEETAAACFYSLPRGDKNIQGPSVRLAEIAVSCYGNLRAGSRAISTVTTGDSPHVVVQAVCHDLERNTLVTIEKRRRIIGKKKNAGKVDEDDINLATNACAAIAFRDAVFKVIPGALIKPVYEQAKVVAVGDAKTLSDRRIKAIELFAKMGIVKDRVLSRLEKKSVEDITLSDLEILIGLHTAIKDSATTLDEAFPAQAKAPKFDAPASTPESKAGADKIFPPKAESTASAPAPEPTPETAVQHLTRVMAENEVPFDDLRDYVKTQNIAKDSDSWASFDEIPEAAATALIQPKTLAKIIKTYGKAK